MDSGISYPPFSAPPLFPFRRATKNAAGLLASMMPKTKPFPFWQHKTQVSWRREAQDEANSILTNKNAGLLASMMPKKKPSDPPTPVARASGGGGVDQAVPPLICCAYIGKLRHVICFISF